MGIYKFYDTDSTGLADYDIKGIAYNTLLETCFRYCSTVSMRIPSAQVVLPVAFERFRIPLTDNILYTYRHYYGDNFTQLQKEVHLFTLAPSVREGIMNITDSIFKWINGWGYQNPEDPAFYRKDGSIFFSSVIHEGECTLTPRQCENVNDIIAGGHWNYVDGKVSYQPPTSPQR